MATVKINEQQKEWFVKAAAGVAVFLFCYMVMIHPVFLNITTLHQNIRDAQKRSELFNEIQALKTSLDGRESVLAIFSERPQLLGRIADLASQTQLRVDKLTPKTEPAGEYTKLRIELEGQGTYFSLLKFLQAVEKMDVAIDAKDVSLMWNPAPNLKEGEYALQVQLVFETFLKQRERKNV